MKIDPFQNVDDAACPRCASRADTTICSRRPGPTEPRERALRVRVNYLDLAERPAVVGQETAPSLVAFRLWKSKKRKTAQADCCFRDVDDDFPMTPACAGHARSSKIRRGSGEKSSRAIPISRTHRLRHRAPNEARPPLNRHPRMRRLSYRCAGSSSLPPPAPTSRAPRRRASTKEYP